MGLTLQRGRGIVETDTLTAPSVVLVNETFARRYFPGQDPIGQHLAPGRVSAPLDARDSRGQAHWSRIVGVVSDLKSLSLQPEPAPEVYRSYWQWPMQAPILFVRMANAPASFADTLRRELRAALPTLPPPKIRLLTERVNESIAQPRFQSALLNLFGGIGLLLAGGGIYSVLAYAVTQRRREIGIRMALGAQRRDVLRLIVGHGLRLTLTGVVLGLAIAAGATRVLRSQLYEVQPADPLTFAGTALLLALAARLACWLPARSAARTEPLVALRCE